MKHKLLALIAVSLLLSACMKSGSEGTAGAPTASANGTTGAQNGQVIISWTASTGSPTGYLVSQSTDNTNYSVVQTVGANASTATISGLTIGTTYYFKICAFNANGDSSYSAVVPATP